MPSLGRTIAATPEVQYLFVARSVGGNGWPGVGVVICVQALGENPPLFTAVAVGVVGARVGDDAGIRTNAVAKRVPITDDADLAAPAGARRAPPVSRSHRCP